MHFEVDRKPQFPTSPAWRIALGTGSVLTEYTCLCGGHIPLLRGQSAQPIEMYLALDPESLFVSLPEPRANASPEKQNGVTECCIRCLR